MITIVNDPIHLIIEIFEEMYPEQEVCIYYAQLPKGIYGETCFPDDGSEPYVRVSYKLAFQHVPEILAHELAHVVTPNDLKHGEEWEKAFSLIHEKYNEKIEEITTTGG